MGIIGITNRIADYKRVEDYRQSIVHAGGDPRVLALPMAAPEALDGLSGLLLTGGEDVAPSRYGETSHSTVNGVNAERDEFELALVAEARRRDLPILAICRGIQILNVGGGGTLVQDIPSEVSGALKHNWTVPPHQSSELAHEVWLDKDTLLARLMVESLGTSDTCEVNSRHHQAVNRIAAGFRVAATAPDGVVEAIEDPSQRFCLGVQWHPENFWRTGEFRPLFEGFLRAGEKIRS